MDTQVKKKSTKNIFQEAPVGSSLIQWVKERKVDLMHHMHQVSRLFYF